MLKSSENKKLDESASNLRRKVNTHFEKEREKEKKIKDKEKELLDEGKLLEYYFLTRFNSMCAKKGIMTGKQADKILEISAPTFSAYKSGDKFPTLHGIERLADKLNVSSGYLLGYTDNPSPILNKANMIRGLTEEARYYLYILSHNIKNDVPDIETDIPYLHLPYCEDNTEFLEIFSLFIADFSNFCFFLTYMRRYVKVKQEINNLDTDENNSNILQREQLDYDLLRN